MQYGRPKCKERDFQMYPDQCRRILILFDTKNLLKLQISSRFLLYADGVIFNPFQEYETVMKGLDRNAPSVPPQNSPQEAQQVEMWKKYIQWEKSNPLRTEDQTLITKRGRFINNEQQVQTIDQLLFHLYVEHDCSPVKLICVTFRNILCFKAASS